MKTTFDLPDLLIRRAKALAARQGRPLRDLVAEAIDERLVAAPGELADCAESRDSRRKSWEVWKARLLQDSDGTWRNPNGVEDDSFFATLEDIRREPWGPDGGPDDPADRPRAVSG